MRSSLTNGLLAIIAFCLVVNVSIQLGFIPTAAAAPGIPERLPPAITEVVIAGIKLNGQSTSSIRATNGTLPINLAQIDNKQVASATPVRTVDVSGITNRTP